MPGGWRMAQTKTKTKPKKRRTGRFDAFYGERAVVEITAGMRTGLAPGEWAALTFDWKKVRNPAKDLLLEALDEQAERVMEGELVPCAVIGGEEEPDSWALFDLLDVQYEGIVLYEPKSKKARLCSNGQLSDLRKKIGDLKFSAA